MRIFVASCFLVAAGLTIGCDSPPSATPATKAGANAKPPLTAVTLHVGDEKKLAEMLASHKGKVVFVDYWATWCGPCVEYFPHTVATHNKYKDRGLATIAVSFDLLEDEGKVEEFLAEQRADFDNLLSNYDDIGQEVAEAFEWSELPQFCLYDRTGKLRHEWKAKPEDLDKHIEELLAEKG
ncbi:MAG: TlpA disulfide reductase family protein [Pirellulaceae bacterium]